MATNTVYKYVYVDDEQIATYTESLQVGGTYTPSLHIPTHPSGTTLVSIYFYNGSTGSYTECTTGGVTIPSGLCNFDFFFESSAPPTPEWSLSTANYGQITQKTSVSYSIGSYVLKRVAVSFKYAGRAYFYSTGSYDTYGYLSTRTEWGSDSGAPLHPIEQNDDDTTGKTTGYNFGFYYDVEANTTYYVWVRALYEDESIYCGIVVEPPEALPPTGYIAGTAVSASAFSVTAYNLRTNPEEYYAIFVADLNTDGSISGYYCRYRGKPTQTSVTYNGSTSETYSKYIRPVYLVYTDTYFSVGTKYQLSAFGDYVIATGAVPSILGPLSYIYHNGSWMQAIPYIYHNGAWVQASPNIYDGGWS